MKEIYTVCCSRCGKEHFLFLDPMDVEKYESGRFLIQDCFPYIAPEERELLISGICPECWDEMFGTDDEEDEGDDIFACEMESLGGNWW